MTDQAPERIMEAADMPEIIWADSSHLWLPEDDSCSLFSYTLTSTSNALIAQARAEGRREGLEEAISHVRDNSMSSMAAEKSIRALIDKDKT